MVHISRTVLGMTTSTLQLDHRPGPRRPRRGGPRSDRRPPRPERDRRGRRRRPARARADRLDGDLAERAGSAERYAAHRLHVEPDGTFFILAMVWRPGQETRIHDHVTWCVFATLQGEPVEDLFTLNDAEDALIAGGRKPCPAGRASAATRLPATSTGSSTQRRDRDHPARVRDRRLADRHEPAPHVRPPDRRLALPGEGQRAALGHRQRDRDPLPPPRRPGPARRPCRRGSRAPRRSWAA